MPRQKFLQHPSKIKAPYKLLGNKRLHYQLLNLFPRPILFPLTGQRFYGIHTISRGRLYKRKGKMGYKKGWSAYHQRILEYKIKGMSNGEIAKTLERKVKAIRSLTNSQKFLQAYEAVSDRMVERARAIFEERSVEAASKIVKLMRQGRPGDKLQFEAAKEVLYQVGCKPVDIVETRRRDYSPEEVASAHKTLKEVEAITNRLGKKSSRFIIAGRVDYDASTSPVPDQTNTSSPVPDQGGQAVQQASPVPDQDFPIKSLKGEELVSQTKEPFCG